MPRPRRIVPRTAVEGFVPPMRRGDALEHFRDLRVLHHRAGRVRPAVAQHVLAPKLHRIDASSRAMISAWHS